MSFREPQLKREKFLEFQTADIVEIGFTWSNFKHPISLIY